MKPLRGFIVVAAALMAAFSAAWLASRYFKKTAPDTVGIVVAGARISSGELLVPENLHIIQWPARDIPPGSFHRMHDLDGRIASGIINKNEPINEKRLRPKQGIKDRDLDHGIKPGMRAVSLKIGPDSDVPGTLNRGDLVDVIAASPLDKKKKERISRVILSGVEVSGVDYKKQGRDGSKAVKPETVTLVLSQEHALTLSASEGAALKLLKRNPFDQAVQDHEEVIFTTSLGPKTASELEEMIAKRDKRLQEGISAGMRAITIRVNDGDGICGLLRPGNRVDVVATHGFISAVIHGKRVPGSEGTVTDSFQASKILMQNVKILFIEEDVAITGGSAQSQNKDDPSKDAREPDPPGKKPAVDHLAFWPTKRVTLLVSPEDAERLAVIATTSANVKLISRKQDDPRIVETKGEKSNEIFFKKEELYHDITIFGRGPGRGTKRFDRKTLEEDEVGLNPRQLEKDLEI